MGKCRGICIFYFKSSLLVIVGIDPGTLVMGYGVISVDKNTISLLEMGVLHLAKHKDHGERLNYIFERVSALVQRHEPVAVALEAPFYGKNVQSMLKLGRAQGVAIAAAMAHGSRTVEYAPKKIKQSVTGNGNASKEQVWKMLQYILKFEDNPDYLDATDAVAVAMCHYYSSKGDITLAKIKTTKKMTKGWSDFIAQNPDRIK
ncbi:MAG: crossover junction endodeoxyribonuclease RuvC [Taibaiella sp.]|nr:crossover junction endodeoxyribonuclease RuvC [Taibaiella sp.]